MKFFNFESVTLDQVGLKWQNHFPTSCREVKMTSMQIKQKSNLKIIFSDYVSTWHEVTSRQVGEKSDASKSLVPNLGTSSKIKKRTSACGRIDHKCYSKIIPDLEIILPIFCPFTKWQAGQTCTGLQIRKQGKQVPVFSVCSSACWGSVPNPLWTSSCEDGCSFILNVSWNAILKKSPKEKFSKIMLHSLQGRKIIFIRSLSTYLLFFQSSSTIDMENIILVTDILQNIFICGYNPNTGWMIRTDRILRYMGCYMELSNVQKFLYVILTLRVVAHFYLF